MGRKIRVRTKKGHVTAKGNKKKHLCIILSENKSTEWIWKHKKIRSFSHNKNHYFIIPECTYISDNNIRCSVYMEGVSTPMSHKNIETIIKEVEIENPDTGQKEKRKVSFIKGLKYDSKLIDMLLNRGLFKEFLTNYLDLQGLLLIIFMVVLIAISVVNVALLYNGLYA